MPRRKSSWVDDLILAPWWVSAALALLAAAVDELRLASYSVL